MKSGSKSSEDILPEYAYELPPELVANAPAEPRDSARLLVYGVGSDMVADAVFRDLADYIPKGALLVMNETKVVPARVVLSKKTGGKVEILFSVNEWDKASDEVSGISDRKLVAGDSLFFDGCQICSVVGQDENIFAFKLALAPAGFLRFLESSGVMPVPKYIKDSPLSETEIKERYQTTFAKNPGSIAAPTASLHFTDAVFKKLRVKGVETAFLTLHVGAGTFAPVTDREIGSGKLHEEFFTVPEDVRAAIKKAKREGRPVIAVGTTALRALESSARGAEISTDIFIKKPFAFKVADGLITNFHVPRSSLMCLVDAFLDFKESPKGILDIYRHAIEGRYRFYSFGDAMFIL
ncbi:MAG TPA: tRNA preQ1(34) S-adenosylmethionine ribosyltransferase-isomerase QueA [Candidatus Paceibacterota bacterium]|nr:tRNA preQ1(34) S-adenosylmethionine ribosyltransferase-isomerase QueA [Candidatus Paceibacterota bacterium]